jgi:Rha family phage regulatory protein
MHFPSARRPPPPQGPAAAPPSDKTSLAMALHWGIPHAEVLRSTRRLHCSQEFRRNFQPASYVDRRGRRQPMVRMTYSGFALLAMNSKSPRAARVVIALIEEFDANVQQARRDKPWLESAITKLDDTISKVLGGGLTPPDAAWLPDTQRVRQEMWALLQTLTGATDKADALTDGLFGMEGGQ